MGLWYADLYDVGWPDAPHRAIRNSTPGVGGSGPVGAWCPAGEGEEIARRASGDPIVRYSSVLSLQRVIGDIEALSLWAGQSVTFAKRIQPAAGIVAELTSSLTT